MCICLVALPIEIHVYMYYNSYCKARVQPFQKGSEDMANVNMTAIIITAIICLTVVILGRIGTNNKRK